ncbi:uncharacterized protein [Drosophila tropicalis]|uniref:uncharacterized protein n=1 Tax=Drosophila tropicalis TaxID=46794 RepID=UPI0035ABCC4D
MVQKSSSFISRNLVAIVMIPSLIGIHLGWSYMQDNRKLVTKEEQIDLPPVTFAKFVYNKLTGTQEASADGDVGAAK